MGADGDATWSGRTVAVTGAGGFVGSTLVGVLVDAGATVRPLVHYRGDGGAGRLPQVLGSERLGEVDLRRGDVRDAEWLRRSVEGCDVVVHLAALVGIPYSYVAPRDVAATNTVGTLNVLEAVRAGDVGRLVHTSTSEVYGSARHVPMAEDHPVSAQSPYAASKVGADALALSYHRSFATPVAVARPFNVYGPGQSRRAVIPTVLAQALAGDVVRIGSDGPTRDFNFVEDTARGLLSIAACNEAVGQVLNIGTGVETSVRRIVELAEEIVGRPLRVEVDAARQRPAASEVDRLVADASRLRELTGWEPTVGLEEGLRRTARWIEANPDPLGVEGYAV